MLPLKVYNSLPINKRRQIARIIFGHMGDEFINRMSEPFHHNFDYDDDGHWYKLMLDHCTYNKEKKQVIVKIVIPV